jgi:FtsP/CotA-like multicopper oxidase with cupredoxin domain
VERDPARQELPDPRGGTHVEEPEDEGERDRDDEHEAPLRALKASSGAGLPRRPDRRETRLAEPLNARMRSQESGVTTMPGPTVDGPNVDGRTTRRRFLALLGLGAAGARALVRAAASVPAVVRAAAPAAVRELRRVPISTEIERGSLGRREGWAYDGEYPGREIRVREGERIRVVVENRLPDPTTIHWHGVPVPNAMDGVPGLTQPPIAPGAEFTYEFDASPAGSYLYHSHQGLQIDRGLVGALVIEERSPHVAYDREYTLVLDDLLPGAPPELAQRGGPSPGRMGGAMMSGGSGMGGMMGSLGIPDYLALLVNGRPPEDPPAFEVKQGERVRLRLLNASGATTYRVAIAGHRMSVSHADGRPVNPVEVDALEIGMGERYDVVVEARNPGAWVIAAAPLHGSPAPARAVLRYVDARSAAPDATQEPEGLRRGRLLRLEDLDAVEPDDGGGAPAREVDLVLSGGMMSPAWTIGGQAYPDAEPIEIRSGEQVRFRIRNLSAALHPMHLHGHFFRVGRAWKDTVLVPPFMGEVSFAFRADNPGRWFFHCHNAYHMEMGMAREVRYVE